MIPPVVDVPTKKARDREPAWAILFNQLKDVPADTGVSWSALGAILGVSATKVEQSYRGAVNRVAQELRLHGRDIEKNGRQGVVVR